MLRKLNMKYVCITCGNNSDKLYHDYKGGIIKISICEKCGNVVDKYIEHDLVIVSLDALLLKRQAFRHVLINSGIESHWKFCLVLLLCEAVTKLLRQTSVNREPEWPPENVLYSALEVDLYWNFVSSAVELFCFLIIVVAMMCIFKKVSSSNEWPSAHTFLCGILLSMFGKMFVLPAILWGHKYSAVYTLLCDVFTAAANIQAVRVLCPKWNIVGLTVSVVMGHLLVYFVSKELQQFSLVDT
ncbi:protein ARV1-like [Mya arenaria]|uniref:protein ARV1-like n=1 Tax=Mya arenaria TaxID=6604 RepID=UPI0022E5C71E|nr:protein ARV1-like [Mya arenaria]